MQFRPKVQITPIHEWNKTDELVNLIPDHLLRMQKNQDHLFSFLDLIILNSVILGGNNMEMHIFHHWKCVYVCEIGGGGGGGDDSPG